MTQDGGFAVTGRTSAGIDTDYNVFLARFNSDGTFLWEQFYGWGESESSTDVIRTRDGGHAFVGGSGGQYFIAKTGPDGSMEWQRDPDDDIVWSSFHTLDEFPEGGFIAGGDYYFGSDPESMLAIRFDINGDVVCSYNGDFATITDVLALDDRNTLAVGGPSPFSEDFSPEGFAIRLGENCEEVWKATVAGKGYTKLESVARCPDGGFVAAGTTSDQSFRWGGGDEDIYIVKLDGAGGVLWERTCGGNSIDRAYHIISTEDGGFLIGGESNGYGSEEPEMFIMKLDADGYKLWDKHFAGLQTESYEGFGGIGQLQDGGYVVCGIINRFVEQDTQVWIGKTYPE